MLNPTVPESPAFALKNRMRVERKTEEVQACFLVSLKLNQTLRAASETCLHAYSQVKVPAPIKALPVPHYLPFQCKPAVKSMVETCPFSFEQREQERRAEKEKRLEQRNDEVWPQLGLCTDLHFKIN